jgi:hypothetical protein
MVQYGTILQYHAPLELVPYYFVVVEKISTPFHVDDKLHSTTLFNYEHIDLILVPICIPPQNTSLV